MAKSNTPYFLQGKLCTALVKAHIRCVSAIHKAFAANTACYFVIFLKFYLLSIFIRKPRIATVNIERFAGLNVRGFQENCENFL